jgi:hypothetical protein
MQDHMHHGKCAGMTEWCAWCVHALMRRAGPALLQLVAGTGASAGSRAVVQVVSVVSAVVRCDRRGVVAGYDDHIAQCMRITI